jgi:hypothetical protein
MSMKAIWQATRSPTIVRLAATAAMLFAGHEIALAQEPTLTGTYEGFFVCDDLTDGAGGAFGRAMTMDVVQSGDSIAMRNTAAVDPSGPPSHTVFQGKVVTAGDGSISGYVEACHSTFPHREIVRIFPASPARTSFSFAADTIFVSDAVPGVHGLVVESCKWSLTRVSDQPPTFEVCE